MYSKKQAFSIITGPEAVRCGLAFAAFFLTISAFAQTKVDLSTQSRNVDFSAATSTKPMKTGTSLPAVCAAGEVFFLLTAKPGANLFACTAINVWSAPDTNSYVSVSAAFPVTISGKTMSVGAGTFRSGTSVFDLPAGATITASGTKTGVVRVYANTVGQIVIGHNMGTGIVSTSSAGYVIDAASAGFPSGSIPLFECSMVNGSFSGTCTDRRVTLTSDGLHAGSSGLVSVDCASGSGCVVDLVPSLVPSKAASNTFTGLNSFQQLQLPVVSALSATDCNNAGKEGRIVYLSTAPSGQRVYVCEGAAGWVLQGR